MLENHTVRELETVAPGCAIMCYHEYDDGNPAGGFAKIYSMQDGSIGIEILWQDGPAGDDPGRVNGVWVEDVISACIDRLTFYQEGQFACGENEAAILALTVAHDNLLSRRADRRQRGVLGQHAK